MSQNRQSEINAWRGGASLDDIASINAASSGNGQAAGDLMAAALVARTIATNLEAGQTPTEADIALYRQYVAGSSTNNQ